MTLRKISIFVITLMLICSGTGTLSNVASAADEFEPNDNLDSASDISPGEYTNLELVSDESDYYALSVDQGETVDVTLTVPKQADGGEPENNPTLRLVDSDGNSLDYGDRRTAPADETIRYTLQYESQSTQTVYIRVYGIDDREVSTSYDLSIDRGTNDRYEPNGVLGSAPSLTPGTYSNLTLLDNENDYYALSVERGETVDITLTVPKQADGGEPENNPTLRLVDSDGNSLDYGDRRTAPADETIRYTLQYESQSTQTVYIRVYGIDDREVSTSYDLSIDRGTNDRYEPNGVLGSAPSLTPGTYSNLTLLDDESDYYALSVDQGETVDVTLTVPKQADGGEPENNPTLRLVDSAGNYLDGGERRTSPADETIRYTLQYESQSTQTVYIRVYGIDDREVSTSYDLSIDRGTNDKYEPNGVLGSAPSLTPGTYSNLTLLDDESDHYALSVERGETVDVTLTVPKQADGGDPENNPVLQLVDSNGNYLDGGERRTAPADETIRYTLQYESQATQTVYIRVYGADDREISTSYDLSINRGTNDRYEPNGVLGSASSLNPGTYSNLTLLDDENDYFRVVVGEGKTASITLTVPKQADGEDPENDPVLRLEDSDGNYLDGGERRTAPADETIRYTLQYESQATQTVYIRVYGADDREVSTSYDLSITGTEPFESEPEPSAPPDINETSLSIEPFPVSTGDAPTVSVNATDTTDAFVNVTVDGQQGSVRMQNVNDDRWEADLSELDAPDMDGLERGSKVELSIVACNEACTPETKTVLNRTEQAYQETELPTSYDESKYPSQVSQKRPLHYFVFDTVVDVPVVLVDFAGQDPGEHGFGSEQQVVQWEKAREYDLNSFFGSGRGAMGSIGFNLVYYDNDGSLYRVRDRSQYRYTEIENGKIELKTEPVDFTNDGKAAALPATAERYVVTHPGESFTSAQVTKPSGEETRMYVAMEDDHYGVWVEEFAHLHLRMGDLYAGGDVQGGISTGIMSSGHGIPAGTAADAKLPDSFSVVSRTELNNLGFTTNSDPDWPWIGTDEQLLRSDSTVDTTVERINETEIGDSTTIVNTGENDQPITGTAVTVPVKYVFQLSPEEKTLNAYRFSERRGRLSTLTEVHEVSSGDRSRISDGRFVEFNVEYVGSQGGLEAEVSTEMVPADEESKVISIIPDLITFDSILGERPNTTAPDVDLRAIDSQGRVTGVTEEGEFVNDIPGARASGDRVQGPEWISVPSDADVEFEVSTADAQTFVNETNVSEENATISYTTSVTEVGENPQLVTENGTVTVTNTTTTTTNETAEPGETKQVSTGFSVAQFDRDDDDVIGFDDLRFALREFNNGNITFDQLRRILRAYNTGEPV